MGDVDGFSGAELLCVRLSKDTSKVPLIFFLCLSLLSLWFSSSCHWSVHDTQGQPTLESKDVSCQVPTANSQDSQCISVPIDAGDGESMEARLVQFINNIDFKGNVYLTSWL